jgi:hypothetical protein
VHDLIADLVVATGLHPDALADLDPTMFAALAHAAMPGRYPKAAD